MLSSRCRNPVSMVVKADRRTRFARLEDLEVALPATPDVGEDVNELILAPFLESLGCGGYGVVSDFLDEASGIVFPVVATVNDAVASRDFASCAAAHQDQVHLDNLN